MSEDLTDQDVESRDELTKAIEAERAKAAGSMRAVDEQYADLKKWWANARGPLMEDMYDRGITPTREDLVAVVMYNIGNAHSPAELAMMLAAKIVDQEE